MKISISIPQYNRIQYLLKSLQIIENQTYENIEIVISDDCSSDDTEIQINNLIPKYKYPIIYSRNEKNEGYDRNYRKCIELATGEYAIVIGNDDSLYGNDSISYLVELLKENNYPDIGFCNCIEERTGNTLIKRAFKNGVLGTGPEVALRNYSCFSFVGGLIYKKETFLKYNTSKYDGSIYSQMYLGCVMVSDGCVLFSVEKPLVIKDILFEGNFRNSYRDRIAKTWEEFKVVNGGIPSVLNVLISSFRDTGTLTQKIAYTLHKRIYGVTYPYWIQDYKSNGALPEAIGLVIGLNPLKISTYNTLSFINKCRIFGIYLSSSFISLIFPSSIFMYFKESLYRFFKK